MDVGSGSGGIGCIVPPPNCTKPKSATETQFHLEGFLEMHDVVRQKSFKL